jgi:prevent-host-death family protein
MAHVSFTDLRQNMASYFDRVTDDREPLLVTPQGGKGNVVILSEAEFVGWQESAPAEQPEECRAPPGLHPTTGCAQGEGMQIGRR